jgi:hypothetical protein
MFYTNGGVKYTIHHPTCTPYSPWSSCLGIHKLRSLNTYYRFNKGHQNTYSPIFDDVALRGPRLSDPSLIKIIDNPKIFIFFSNQVLAPVHHRFATAASSFCSLPPRLLTGACRTRREGAARGRLRAMRRPRTPVAIALLDCADAGATHVGRADAGARHVVWADARTGHAGRADAALGSCILTATSVQMEGTRW